ncbi:MAG TPA: DUF1080 domain-containing protein [Chitinophagaceae bacterium]|nr:DUF1080 domain-containing protein [Chitinophagaceae bacterium]
MKIICYPILAALIGFSACHGHTGSAASQTPDTARASATPIALSVAVHTDTLTSREKAEGWVQLFDGTDLKGWHSYLKNAPGSAWTVRNGSILLDTGVRNGYQVQGGGDLTTDGEYGNFDLRLQWNIQPCGNSGIIFYVHEDTAYHETWNTGPEMQVLDSTCDPDQKSYLHHVGDIYDLIACNPQTAKPSGNWNDVEILSNQGHLQCFMNGTKVVDTHLWDAHWNMLIAKSKFRNMPHFGTYRKGHIALQDHGAMVWYRDIRIRNL